MTRKIQNISNRQAFISFLIIMGVMFFFTCMGTVDSAPTHPRPYQFVDSPSENDVLTVDGSSDWKWTAISAISGTPAGSDTEIQWNDSGAFGAEAAFTYNDTGNLLGLGAVGDAGQATIFGILLLRDSTSGDVHHYISGNDTVVFNEDSAAGFQFRVESAATANAFLLNGDLETITLNVVTTANADFLVQGDAVSDIINADVSLDTVFLNGTIDSIGATLVGFEKFGNSILNPTTLLLTTEQGMGMDTALASGTILRYGVRITAWTDDIGQTDTVTVRLYVNGSSVDTFTSSTEAASFLTSGAVTEAYSAGDYIEVKIELTTQTSALDTIVVYGWMANQ